MSLTKAQLLAPVGIFTGSGINVSGTLTATSYSGSGANLSGVGVGTTASVNTSGIITAVSFSGDGVNLSGVGFGTEDSAVTTGIITASKFVGSGIGLTNIGGPIAGLVYSPSIGATSVSVGTNIEIIFSKPIQAGVGTITLRTDAADGTIVESYDVESSSNLTINTAKLTIDPTASLSGVTTYFVVIPSGTVKDTFAGISSNVGITTYSFTTQQLNFELYSFGANNYGDLGQNNTTQYSSPIQIPGTQWNSISHGYYGNLATKTDGTLWAWGYNTYGGLGHNDETRYSSPRQIPGTQWDSIRTGVYSVLAAKTDGTLWAWGYNNRGQLGQNDQINRSSPTQIPGTQWTQATGNDLGRYFTHMRKTDGTLWAWGANYYGNLGQNNGTYFSSPVQIPGTQWLHVSGGKNHTTALKTDGTLWAWGVNQAGELGQNNAPGNRSSPVQVPGTQWATVTSGSYWDTLATKTDGTLWAWGYNNYGELGLNNAAPSQYSSPTQVPGTQWSTTIGDNKLSIIFNAGAIKTDGTLWTWGYNSAGSLGLNEASSFYSSPIQVPGTQWYKVNTGYFTTAIKQVAP